MRPLRIEVEGFSAFRDRAVVDLTNHDLVAFTGPTGAGKSSLIDAMTFALYGSVARYKGKSKIGSVIHQAATEARVRFDFEVGDNVYSAVRVARLTSSGANTKEARLERFDGLRSDSSPDSRELEGDSLESTVLAGSVKELDSEVERIIGLNFDQFTRTIVLPQGDFAAFLSDKAESRQALLRQLLGVGIYRTVGARAREYASQASAQVDALSKEQQHNPAPSKAELEAMAATVEALNEALPRIDEVVGEHKELSVEHRDLLEKYREFEDAIVKLDAIVLPDGLVEAEASIQNLAVEIEAAEESLVTVNQQRDAAVKAVDEIADRTALAALLDRLNQLSALDKDEEAEVQRASEAVASLQAATATSQELTARYEQAAENRRAAQQDADASHWTASLVIGKACPVCKQEVSSIPEHNQDEALSKAQSEVDELEVKHRKHQSNLLEATQAGAAANALVERAGQKRTDLTADVEQMASDLQGLSLPKDIDKQIAVVHEQLDAAALAASEMESLAKEVRQLEQSVTGLRRQRAEHQADHQRQLVAFSEARDTVAALRPPTPQHKSLLSDWESLIAWASAEKGARKSQQAEVKTTGEEVAGKKRAKESAIGDYAMKFGIADDPGEIAKAALRQAAQQQATLDSGRNHRDEHEARQRRIEEYTAHQKRDSALQRLLRSDGFEAWLLDEAFEDMVVIATKWLLQLSGGQYSLVSAKREFAIIDHNNADQQRDVRSLSGGETFLTSLALALALADSIAELAPVDSPRLEAMFLDEGFGSLDPDTLDVVASAIEELAAEGRMIGVVTHIRELAERMPVRFEVSKGPKSSIVEMVTL